MFFIPYLYIQAVDHPYLVVYSHTAALRGGSVFHNGNDEQVCGICHDPAEDPVVSPPPPAGAAGGFFFFSNYVISFYFIFSSYFCLLSNSSLDLLLSFFDITGNLL